MVNVRPFLRLILFIWLYDLKQKVRRLLYSLPVSWVNPIKKISKKMYSLFLISGYVIYLYFSTLFLIIILELWNLNTPMENSLLPYACLLLIILTITKIGSIWGFERHALTVNDYTNVLHSPTPCFLFIVLRFSLPNIVQSLLYWLCVITPLLIAISIVYHPNSLFILISVLTAVIFIIYNLAVSGLFGIAGLLIQRATRNIPSSIQLTAIFLITGLLFGAGESLITYGWSHWKSLFHTAIFDYSSYIYGCTWLPTNWLVYSLQSAFYGNTSRSLLWMGALTTLVLSAILLFIMCAKGLLRTYVEQPYQISEHRYTNKSTQILTKLAPSSFRFIIEKDLKLLLRNRGLLQSRLIRLTYFISGLLGFMIGTNTISINEWKIALLSVPVSIYLCDLIGQALLPITSLDAEKENISLYLRSGYTALNLFLSKVILHIFITTILLVPLLCAILGIYSPSPHIVLISFCCTLATVVVRGIVDVGSTAIYPCFDSEHIDDIGFSVQGVLFSVLGNYLYLIIMVSGVGLFQYCNNHQFLSNTQTGFLTIGWFFIVTFLIGKYTVKMIKAKGTTSWERMR